jgi:hypothetical protein
MDIDEPTQTVPEIRRTESPLLNLPPELLHQILEYLVPEQPDIGGTRPVAYNKLVPSEPWYEYTRCRRGLRSLCLTSRGLYNLAQPLLYRVVSILDEAGLVLLFRTLTQRPELGLFSNYLSCHLTLTREGVIRETRRELGRLIRTFSPDMGALGPDGEHKSVGWALATLKAALPHLSTLSGDFDDMPQIIVFFLMQFMKKLEAILLQVPISDRHPEYTALFEKVTEGMGAEWRSHLDEPSSPTFSSSRPQGFEHIKTLYLQGDPEMLQHFETDDCDCEVPDIFGVEARRYWPLYNALPNLRTLEVSADDGVWHNVRPRGPDHKRAPYLQGIKHIYLHDSIACPRNMYQVLRNAPQLRTLYMVPRRDDAFLHGPEEDNEEAHPEALDNALLRRTTKLRELDVAWWDCAGYESLIGPKGRLSNLPQMTAMEKLCVQLAVLYGTDQQEMLHTPLVDLLPPNLIELTLEEWWWGDIDDYDYLQEWCGVNQARHWEAKANYRNTALTIMRGFASSCRERMPRLRKVSFMTRLPWTWKLEGRVDLKSHFGEIREIFRGVGIEFLVEEIL